MRNIISTANIIIHTIISIIIISLAMLSCTSILQLVFAQEQILLEAFTDQGTFKVQIIWTSNAIGSLNMFEIQFIDPDTGSEIEDVKYDISVYRDDQPQIRRLDQVSIFQEFFFEDVGSYEIRIDDIEDLGERATIPIQVTPEFGLNIILLTAATLGVVVVSVMRSNNNNLFR